MSLNSDNWPLFNDGEYSGELKLINSMSEFEDSMSGTAMLVFDEEKFSTAEYGFNEGLFFKGEATSDEGKFTNEGT